MSVVLGLVLVAWTLAVARVAVALARGEELRRQDLKRQAYKEILRDKGIELAPGESIRCGLLRAKRHDSEAPAGLRP